MQTATVKWIAREEFQATMPSGHTVPFDADRTTQLRPRPHGNASRRPRSLHFSGHRLDP